MSFLLTGFLLFGGIGWGLDELFGTRWCTPVGLLTGGVASVYLVWIRYGSYVVSILSDGPRPDGEAGRSTRGRACELTIQHSTFGREAAER